MPAIWNLACLLQNSEPPLEVLRFEAGAEIRGRVLRETAERLFVDVGYTVLDVPKGAVLHREPVEPGGGHVRAESIYFTAELSPAPIRELADRFGEGVVLVRQPGGLGSGFIVNAEQGYVVTNYHVIARERRISVMIFKREGTEFRPVTKERVRIVAISPAFDLALLKIEDAEPGELRQVYLGDYQRVRNGDVVFAIGNPLGLSRTISEGIVSNRARDMGGHLFIQTTAQINPGNSGGPLFNDRGEVIGVTSMKLAAAGVEGMGFAIPVRYVRDFLENREAFAFDKTQPNTGVRYYDPPSKPKEGP
jgi:serine protease Do